MGRLSEQSIVVLGGGRPIGMERYLVCASAISWLRSKFVLLTKFLRLLPISPLSTGLLPKILLSRLGSDVHGDQVIGTAVPASPRAGNGARVRRVVKGPVSSGRPWGEQSRSGRGPPANGGRR